MKWFENCDDLASDIDFDYNAIEDDHDSDSIGEEIVDDARDIEENIEKKHNNEERQKHFFWEN